MPPKIFDYRGSTYLGTMQGGYPFKVPTRVDSQVGADDILDALKKLVADATHKGKPFYSIIIDDRGPNAEYTKGVYKSGRAIAAELCDELRRNFAAANGGLSLDVDLDLSVTSRTDLIELFKGERLAARTVRYPAHPEWKPLESLAEEG